MDMCTINWSQWFIIIYCIFGCWNHAHFKPILQNFFRFVSFSNKFFIDIKACAQRNVCFIMIKYIILFFLLFVIWSIVDKHGLQSSTRSEAYGKLMLCACKILISVFKLIWFLSFLCLFCLLAIFTC